jgi:hypothetical protein
MFGQVCRYWRNVSISTSRLWSAFSIDLRARNMDRDMDMAATWIARSGGAPLSVKLCSYREMTSTHPIIDVLLAHAPRLCMLLVAFHASLSIIHSFRSSRGRFPSLIIDPDYCRDASPIPQLLDAFEVAPKLSYVKLTAQVSILKQPNFPIMQLRELYLFPTGHMYTLDEFLCTLHNAPHLVKLSMDLNTSEPQSHPPHAIVQHSNLRELRVGMAGLDTPLAYIALPALVGLSCYGLATWDEEEFISFLHRSSCVLQELALDATVSDSENWDSDFGDSLTECLQHTPSLLKLELSDGICAVIQSDFWVALTDWGATPYLVPKLRRIIVTRYFDFDYEGFVRMVQSRWRVRSDPGATNVAVDRIRNVQVRLMDDHESYDQYNSLRRLSSSQWSFSCLRQFRAEGLYVFAPDIDDDDSSSGLLEE